MDSRIMCIYVEKRINIGEFYDASNGGGENLKMQGLHNLCTHCKFKGNCQVKKNTDYRYFSKKETTRYIKW